MTTLKQIVEASDPGIALIAFKDDEAALLREIVAIMCLDTKCKKMFEAILAEGYSGVPHFSSYGSDYDDVLERLHRLRDRINSHTEDLREMHWPHTKGEMKFDNVIEIK